MKTWKAWDDTSRGDRQEVDALPYDCRPIAKFVSREERANKAGVDD